MRYTYFPKQELKFSHPENGRNDECESVLSTTERGLEAEAVNVVESGARRWWEVTVDSGACSERMAERCHEDKGDEGGETGGSKRLSDTRGRRRENGVCAGR